MSEKKVQDISFTRVNNDINGNPRYVFHFLELAEDYKEAHTLAKSIGAAKYRSKDFVGGFVIQSFNLYDTAKSIKEIKSNK